MKPNKNIAVLAMQGIKGIIFDKDGTILDFYKTWRPILDKIMTDMREVYHMPEEVIVEISHLLGITDDGFTDDSLFVKGDYNAILDKAKESTILDKATKEQVGAYMERFAEEEAHKYTSAHVIPGVESTLDTLRKQGFVLGLITSDLERIANKHLEETALRQYFDYVGCDDGKMQVKPHPDMLLAFCQAFNLEPHEVAMVGDSMTDMVFAKDNHLGYGIYVRSGYPNARAEKMADMMLEDVGQLIQSRS